VDDEYKFLYSDEELAKVSEKEGKEIEEDVLELFEAPEIEQIIARIEKFGLDISMYAPEIEARPKEASYEDTAKKTKAFSGLAAKIKHIKNVLI